LILTRFLATRGRKPLLSKLWQLYDNTGIECRYNCEPIEWYLRPHSWEERTDSFRRHALDLLEEVTVKTTVAAGVALNEIDMCCVVQTMRW
jgi:alkylresorcinol/alkylpyrone synthase